MTAEDERRRRDARRRAMSATSTSAQQAIADISVTGASAPASSPTTPSSSCE